MLNWLIRKWVERYFTEKKISEILDACITGITEWYAKDENKKWLLELLDYCGKGLISHLEPTKEHEETDTNLPDPPCA